MRAIGVALLVGVLAGMILSAVLPATAQPVTPADEAIVGAWSARDGLSLSFFADGNLIGSDADGNIYHGAWHIQTTAAGEAPLTDGRVGDILFTMARMTS